ncbi:uncharacterized protein LOC101734072 [Xenopus tropicalis]|uniref:Uncharacterized protein LOC101734072 n=1 Tax=Xenopus tropicalis TaxID=8364 RepID=A0A8J1JUK5_XENTR|nr:uncharacterized protein LOC101734072 [Xenopus tropicalis]
MAHTVVTQPQGGANQVQPTQMPITPELDREAIPSTSAKPPQLEDLFDWIKSTIQSTISQSSTCPRKRKSQALLDTNSSDTDVSEQDSEPELGEVSHSDADTDDSGRDQHYHSIASPDTAKRLLRDMLATLEIKDDRTTASKADRVLGVQPKKARTFPVSKSISQLIENKWAKPDHRLTLTQRFLTTYPIPEEQQKLWDKAPRVDSTVAHLSKNTALPTEEAAFNG